MANKLNEATRVEVPRSAVMSKSLISHKMVHELSCPQEHTYSLPTPIETDTDSADAGDANAASQAKINEIIYGSAKLEKPLEIKYAWNRPRLMLIFQDGDINCAILHLLSSLQDPYAKDAVVTLLIEESVLEQFTDRLVNQMRALPSEVANHPVSLRTRAKILELNAKTILGNPDTVPPALSPVLVYDFVHHYLGEGPTGVITLHTFRTPKEATQVYLNETVPYSSASIWNEKLASAYETVALLKCDTFMINCFDINLEPIQKAFDSNQNDVKIYKGYHYETFSIRQQRKIVVFPVGSIFAN